MNKILKGRRLLSLLLAIILLITMLPSGVLPVSSQEVEQTTSQMEKHPDVDKVAKLKSFFGTAYVDPTNSSTGKVVGNTYYPALVVITGVQIVGSKTYYQLSAAEGNSWPKVAVDVGLTDGFWLESSYVIFVEPCEKCGKLGCESGHENWCDICKVDDCPNDHLRATVTDSEGKMQTIFVTGDLPDGAKLEVSIPEIDDKKLPNVFDIKVYDANGNEWQPGSAVTIAIPVSDPAIKFVDVIHIIDHKEAIHDGVEYWPIEGADEDVLSLLAPAITASDKEGYVAVELFKDISVADGVVKFETSSFSIYELNVQNEFKVSSKGNQIEFDNGASSSQLPKYYATPGTGFRLYTGSTVTMKAADNGKYFNVVSGSDYIILDDEIGGAGGKVEVSIRLADDIPMGTELKVKFRTKDWIFGAEVKNLDFIVIVVRPVNVIFEDHLPEGIVISGMPEDRILYSETNDKRVYTDGNLAKYRIPATIPTAANPADSGDTYTFLEWNTSPDGKGTAYSPYYEGEQLLFSNSPFTPVKDVTLYAMWKRQECTVTFDNNNGTNTTSSITQEYNSYLAVPDAPERPGYVFLGWCTSKDGDGYRYYPATDGKPADTVQLKSDVTLYALWGVPLTIDAIGGTIEVQKHGESGYTQLGVNNSLGFQVTSKIDNGVTTTTYYVVVPEGSYGEAFFKFVLPSGSNKTIRGQSSGSKVEFLKAIGTDNLTGVVLIDKAGLTEPTHITLTAENKMIVSFDAKGGSAVSSVLVSKGDPINLNNHTTKREGYDFDGWFDSNGNKVEGNYTVNADITFTAHWTPKKFDVTLNTGEGITSVNGAGKYDYSSPVTVTATVKPGYRFVNWVGSGVANSASQEYTFLVPNGNVTLTANADAIEYTITYILEGGTGVVTSQKYTVNDVIQLPTPTKEGFNFTGWKVTAGDSEWVLNHVYSLDQLTIASGQYGDVTLSAQWHQETYTVTWIADGSKTEAYKIGETIKLPSNPSKVGYYFDGWDGYTEGMTMPDEDVTFTAKWVKINYSIEFLESNGTQVEGVETITFDIENVTELQLPTPEKGGSNFLGWYTTRDLTGKPCDLETLSQLLLNQNDSKEVSVKLYAKWEASVTSMTIKVEGCNTTLDPNQSFLFTVEGPDGVKLKVTVLENGSVTIHGVTIGQTYTVTMDNAWSWRYSIKNGTDIQGNDNVTSAAVAGNCVTFTLGQNGMLTFKVTRNTDKWLDGNAYYKQ